MRLCIKLLRTKDAEQIEWSFTCLAYLFKFLWRLIVRDIKPVFECIVHLLGDDQPPYVNDFAAECFSFVARKVKDKKNFLKMVLKNLKHKRDVNDILWMIIIFHSYLFIYLFILEYLWLF